MNEDLESVLKWLNTNKVKNNNNKTKSIIIGKTDALNNIPPLYIDHTVIEYVSSMKYLGVIIDSNLKFDCHFSTLISKLNQKVNYFNRINKSLSQWSRTILFNTIILPHILYCSSLLFTAPKKVIDDLQKLQNRCMRSILNKNIYTRTSHMLAKLNWFDIENLIQYYALVFIHNSKNNTLSKFLTLNSNIHSHNTRQLNHYHLDQIKGTFFRKGLNIYNELPTEMKEMNEKLFKIKLKEHMLRRNV